eukprot:TRINITY_DN18098_c4_g1_i1.p1 TRINITY_DN18098_c4_g1~~TRINITY_DN18098_c4_g1_i1.p1  ORF type:complete len:136 (+),score=18.26 TRINITY_DN18098_c4_g1_i1:49-408(+)
MDRLRSSRERWRYAVLLTVASAVCVKGIDDAFRTHAVEVASWDASWVAQQRCASKKPLPWSEIKDELRLLTSSILEAGGAAETRFRNLYDYALQATRTAIDPAAELARYAAIRDLRSSC